jgi:hypothetical protein
LSTTEFEILQNDLWTEFKKSALRNLQFAREVAIFKPEKQI